MKIMVLMTKNRETKKIKRSVSFDLNFLFLEVLKVESRAFVLSYNFNPFLNFETGSTYVAKLNSPDRV